MYSLRYYQQKAVDAVYEHLRKKDNNPCAVLPTAAGKSICIAQIAKDAVMKWNGRVLILAHVKELVEQNAAKLKAICPELPVGIYSAGLESRDTEQPVVVASIQSIYNKSELLKPVDLVICDECHLIRTDNEGMYRTFLAKIKEKNPNLRVIGFTATPFRTQGGLICKPENLLNEVCYEMGIKRLISDGYISKITAHAGRHVADTENLHIRAGEFVAEDVEKLMSESGLVSSACQEIVALTKDRTSCLIFCTSVAHCRQVAKLITQFSGEECAVVTGDTPADERENTIRRLRGETVKVDLLEEKPPLKYCCNVSVLTTGTDVPRLDTIALLRPTNSPGLFIQMVGRGFRLSPGKENCLARGTQILTDVGLVPIEDVTADMKVWDGVEFVSHDGAVCKGTKEVISYAGLTATPDHKVWTGNNWRTLGECASGHIGISVTGAGGNTIREIDGVFRYGEESKIPNGEDAALSSNEMQLRDGCMEEHREPAQSYRRVSKVWMSPTGAQMAGATVRGGEDSLRESNRSAILGLRGTGHNIRVQRSNRDGLLSNGTIFAESSNADRQNRQQLGLCAGQSSPDYTIHQYDEQEASSKDQEDAIQNRAPRDTICGRDAGSFFLLRYDGRGDCQTFLQTVEQAQGEVWDILNAGPRHRFTANGLLVSNCLVLDYGRNIERFGPIDCIKVNDGAPASSKEPLVKTCPQCQNLVALSVMRCPECGYEFPRKEPERKEHEAHAANAAILSGEIHVETYDVEHTQYQVWTKRGAPPDAPKTVRVTYFIDYLTTFSEWLCPEHMGYARRKFERWWRDHGHPDALMPKTADEVCEHDFAGMIRETKKITVRTVSGSKYPEITGYELGDFPTVAVQNNESEDFDYDDIPF